MYPRIRLELNSYMVAEFFDDHDKCLRVLKASELKDYAEHLLKQAEQMEKLNKALTNG